MKKRNLIAIFCALAMSLSLSAVALTGCGDGGKEDPDTPPVVDPGDPDTPVDPDKPNPPVDPDKPNPPQVVIGLPAPDRGHYISNSDLLVDGETRWLVYTTNETAGEQDNVIAVRKGTYVTGEQTGWAYGEEHIALTGGAGAWDEYIGSASIVKGEYQLGGVSYSWLMAYSATAQADETQSEIGLAVATSPDGEWVKVGTQPVIEFNAAELAASQTSLGCYAPSLVNYNKESGVRIFYSYADQYGHFAKFVDLDAANLDTLSLSGEAMVPTNGQVSGGDSVTMFPNADFAYDATSGRFYAIKDYSPAASLAPSFADKLQLLYIAADELITTDEGAGWVSVRQWDNTDTLDGMYERLYGACIVSDAYGHTDGATAAEIVYNVCDLEMDNADYIFSQKLMTFEVDYE